MRAMPLLTGFILLWATLPAYAQEPGARPPVELIVVPGGARAVPLKKGVAYANGGVINVTQPTPTIIVVTMTGLAAVNADAFCTSLANYHFDLAQGFEVVINSKQVKSAKLTLEGHVIGLLRTEFAHQPGCWHGDKSYGTAETLPAVATVQCGATEFLTLTLPARIAAGCEDLSVYNHEGPLSVPVPAGKYMLQETWGFGATHAAFHSRGASAEFSPQPFYGTELAPLIGYQPFNGLATRDFGFQVTLKVTPELEGSEKETGPDKKP